MRDKHAVTPKASTNRWGMFKWKRSGRRCWRNKPTLLAMIQILQQKQQGLPPLTYWLIKKIDKIDSQVEIWGGSRYKTPSVIWRPTHAY